ncbi:group II intron reverse transcriptase domain-containing protein [Candidatus Uhrbacteria bacterium]|nr:group II intron reverse transcriptase domain-containing protein [Candidatus Uhrbacteria bacterium]
MKIQLSHKFEDIISIDNLLEAWKEFARGKKSKLDVQEFSFRLMDNILALNAELFNHTYRHGGYQAFNISDPKPRNIHKAGVRDRLLHHAIYRILYPFFDKTFISDSYSCRIDKGTHKALNRFRSFAYKASGNKTGTCWVLKCDIRKFFANIDHGVLIGILQSYIPDQKIMWLLNQVIKSFGARPVSSATAENTGKGLPLGNLTSQLLVNIYMNEFDQFVKHKLKVKYYIRYADDFVIMSPDKQWLQDLIPRIALFLGERLKLALHSNKTFIKTLASGVDFLGWVHFSDHRVLRTATRRRVLARLRENLTTKMMTSYFGLLKHGNTYWFRGDVLL